MLDAGSTFATATNVGALAGLVKQFESVGPFDTIDFFKLTMSAPGDLHVRLTSFPAKANLFVSHDTNNNGVLDAGELLATSTNGSVDLAGLAKGPYYVEVYAPFLVAQTSYTLNLTADYAGQTLGTARNIGTVNGLSPVYTDLAGPTDLKDYYKVTTAASGRLAVKLSGLGIDLDLTVFDSQGNSIATSEFPGTSDENITLTVAKGTYYVEVRFFYIFLPGTPDTNYNLQLMTDYAGDSPNDLRNLGDVTGKSFTAVDYVGDFGIFSDWNDQYAFTVTSTRKVTIKMTGLTSAANLNLYNDSANQNYIGGTGYLAADQSFVITLSPGTYYLDVFSTAGTNYKLSLTA